VLQYYAYVFNALKTMFLGKKTGYHRFVVF